MAKHKLITSVINHNIRVELGLTCDEYIVMDILLENYCRQPFAFANLETEIGFTVDQFIDILADLVLKEMVYVSGKPVPVYIISDRWLSKFNVDGDFQEFWTIFREYGNRINALKHYKIVRKSVDKETLHEAAKAYLAYCDITYSDTKYVNNAQIWLNPATKKWEDKLKVPPAALGAGVERKHDYL